MKFNKEKALNQAQELAKDFNASEADEFASKHEDKAWYSDFITLLDMLRDDSFRLDSKTYLAIAGALAYVVLPLDVIPDFIPGIGFLDDIFVVSIVIKSLADEVARYKEHVCSIAA